ncbi:MAG: YfhO family protein [Flavobacteriales bacterium]|nr:YfhO family protein [Flavobacteriales bacterium]MCB9446989.1 YfhO family protein [Flavobacteriales bacterium]
MRNFDFKKLLPHLVAIVVFLLVVLIQCKPVFEGKELMQSDIIHYRGMSKELVDFKKETGERTFWVNNMFSGMPSYLISADFQGNMIGSLHKILTLGLPRPASFILLYFMGFYLLLIVLRVKPSIAIAGALAFGLASYNFIILEAGHTSKANAIGYMAPVAAGVILMFQRRLLAGFLMTAIFLSLEIKMNHPQITYYLVLTLGIFWLIEAVQSWKKKVLPLFARQTGLLALAGMLALGTNAAGLWATYSYSKHSIRGPSELTLNGEHDKTSGLDKSYATQWSYGVAESFTLLVPNFMGGASGAPLDKSSATYKALHNAGVPNADKIIEHLPLYWGSQPFTSGPVYVGAIICFLFVLSIMILKGPVRIWLVSATVLSLMLAWGKNFSFLTDLFLNHFPAYNKFRAVSMTLVIASLTMPLAGMLALRKIQNGEVDKDELWKKIKLAFYITGGLALFIALLGPSFFSFTSDGDAQLRSAGWPGYLMDAFVQDRQNLMRMDAFRSFVFILLTAGVLYFAFVKTTLKRNTAGWLLALLVIVDMWPIDWRYLTYDDFVPANQMEQPYQPSQADLQISQDHNGYYRVFNTTRALDQDSETSYWHKSLGGYHGAKLRRYQELISYQISKGNMQVLNMLNTRYLIVPGQDKQPMAQRNPGALGNAWFVNDVKLVANADSEMTALSNFQPANTAIVDKRFSDNVQGWQPGKDESATINLTKYAPNQLTFESSCSKEQLAVFSDIYYADGWNAYVDGKPAPHFRADYVLRAMRIPSGTHQIEFKFEPVQVPVGEKISWASSGILILLAIGLLFKMNKQNPAESDEEKQE